MAKRAPYREFGEQLGQLFTQLGIGRAQLFRHFILRTGFQAKTLQRWLDGENLPSRDKWDPASQAFRGLLKKPDPVLEAGLRSVEMLLDATRRRKPESASRSRPQPFARAEPAAPGGPHETRPFAMPPLPPQRIQGRTRLLGQLIRLLMPADRDDEVPPVALWGIPGVGKTTIANALVHRADVEAAFPDGIVWMTLGPKPAFRQLLNEIGAAFGVDLIPEHDEGSCAMRLRSILHSRRALLVLDDVWEPEHTAAFMLTGPLGRTLLTTRETRVAYPLATRHRSLRVQEVSPNVALAMLREVAPEAVKRNRALALQLCRRLEYLPLGINLAGRLLAQETEVSGRLDFVIAQLIEHRKARLQLTQHEPRPGLKRDHPVSIEAIIGMSVERLNDIDQQRFALLSLWDREPLFWVIEHVAQVWDCSVGEAEATTSRLIQRGLVEKRRDQYWMHALLADYAAELRQSRGL